MVMKSGEATERPNTPIGSPTDEIRSQVRGADGVELTSLFIIPLVTWVLTRP